MKFGVERVAKCLSLRILMAAALAIPLIPSATGASPVPRATVPPAADAAAMIQTAQRQFNTGNYSGAISTLQAAISNSSINAEAYYWLGRSYYEILHYDNAITAAEK